MSALPLKADIPQPARDSLPNGCASRPWGPPRSSDTRRKQKCQSNLAAYLTNANDRDELCAERPILDRRPSRPELRFFKMAKAIVLTAAEFAALEAVGAKDYF